MRPSPPDLRRTPGPRPLSRRDTGGADRAATASFLRRPLAAAGEPACGAERRQSQEDRAYLVRFGHRLRVHRTRRGLRQDDVAALAELDRPYISRVERGQHSVSILSLARIGRTLGVHPGELLP